MKAANYLNIITDQLHPYMALVFPTGNGIFQQDTAPCHKARIVMEWFEEHTDEFHLMSWPPNSPDLNPMEHIWDVMELLLRAQTPQYPNISNIRVTAAKTFGTTCLQSCTKNLWHLCPAVLKAKGGATRY
ncbi:hypothetical protein AVEN_220739-1 [Araneus ventricosus]|uniref:Tc1-like transposase DDE domain-containing protein n=1 Tax=Araneus ventricosus TaxID=182803 RepID=A0A4Y2RRR6_ARAVE|nr:hypothetical protein AVEN_179298-1 [Araneus ventricosus]GBN78059.1 hypothetical protein AVEN_220739-1 [Araneus ventricosus]